MKVSNKKNKRITQRLTETFVPFIALEWIMRSKHIQHHIVPGRKAVLKIIHEPFGIVKNTLCKDLLEALSVATTQNTWTSIKFQSYDYIAENWVLNAVVRRPQFVTSPHTGKSIASNLQDTAK